MCHLNILNCILFIYLLCLCAMMRVQARVHLAGRWLTSPTVWVPGMEFRSSDLVAGAPTHEAILPALFSLK